MNERRSGRAQSLLRLGGLLLIGCPPSNPDPSALLPELEMGVSGCHERYRSESKRLPDCELPSSPNAPPVLTVWGRSGDGVWLPPLSNPPSTFETVPIDGGMRWTIHPSALPARLTFRAAHGTTIASRPKPSRGGALALVSFGAHRHPGRDRTTSLSESAGNLAEAAGLFAPSEGERALEGCSLQRSEAAINLALSALEQGEEPAARGWLDRAEGWGILPRDELWAREARARLELQEGRPERALKAVAGLLDSPLPPIAVAAASVAIEAHIQAGRPEQALAVARTTRSVIEAGPAVLELQRGWSHLLGHLARVTQLQVELLIDQGKVEEAFAVDRSERRRAFRARWQTTHTSALSEADRERWDTGVANYLYARGRYLEERRGPEATKALEETQRALRALRLRFFGPASSPPAVSSGALALLTHPGPAEWRLFVATATSVTTQPLAPFAASEEELAQAFQRSLDTL